MKNNKIKLFTLILLVILIIMVGFFGVYSREKGIAKNDVKDYQYSLDLYGADFATIDLSTATKEIIKNQDGNIIKKATDEEIEKNNYVKEEIPVNGDEAKTVENYNLSKEVIKERLEKLGVSNYIIRVNEETGKVVLELPENDNVSSILNVITQVGNFEIVDEETQEVLLNKDDISTSNIYRNSTSYGTEISFSIEFTSEGAKKLEEISKKYVAVKEEEKESETTENSGSETTENVENTEITENTANTEETATTEETEKEKKVTLKLDDTELMSTSFDEPVTTGKMYLTVGQAATTSEDLQSHYRQAQKISVLLSTRNLPLTYTQNKNVLIQSPVKDSITDTMLIGIAIVVCVAFVLLAFKFKFVGILSGICYAGFTAILLLTVRYWNVELSIEGVVAIFAILVLNYILIRTILNKLKQEEDNKKMETKHVINMAIKDFTIKIIPLFILGIVFAFANWMPASSFGMVAFWGLALIELYNLFITKYIIKYSK